MSSTHRRTRTTSRRTTITAPTTGVTHEAMAMATARGVLFFSPFYGYGGLGYGWGWGPEAISYEAIPRGEVTIRRGEPVQAIFGEKGRLHPHRVCHEGRRCRQGRTEQAPAFRAPLY
jgi:hypothetical protein